MPNIGKEYPMLRINGEASDPGGVVNENMAGYDNDVAWVIGGGHNRA